ncbi:MAG: hypothetical protein ACJAZS_000194 [Alteromonas naphthalenivorans]|jgi:hypothetical protein
MFKSLKHVLNGSFSMNTNSWKTKLLSEWPTIVGSLHDKITLEKIYEDTIVIGVYEAAWLQELYMLSSVLIKTINGHLDKPYIKKIRFKHATRIEQKKNFKKTIKTQSTPREKVTLNSLEARALLKIKDVEMRNSLHLFLSRCKTKES